MNKNQRCQGSESTNGPCHPCPASLQASLSPSMAQDPISAQPGAVSPCPAKLQECWSLALTLVLLDGCWTYTVGISSLDGPLRRT